MKVKDKETVEQECEPVEELEVCPECLSVSVRAKGINEGGGVECTHPDCDYWFCF